MSISSDARTATGEWIQITRGGQMRHVVNVVGYGEDLDPQTLCKVNYFNVRDGLSPKGYAKIPASNLLAYIVGVYKVTEVGEVGEVRSSLDTQGSSIKDSDTIKRSKSTR